MEGSLVGVMHLNCCWEGSIWPLFVRMPKVSSFSCLLCDVGVTEAWNDDCQKMLTTFFYLTNFNVQFKWIMRMLWDTPLYICLYRSSIWVTLACHIVPSNINYDFICCCRYYSKKSFCHHQCLVVQSTENSHHASSPCMQWKRNKW